MNLNDEKDFLEKITLIERNACKGSFFEFFLSFWPIISKEDLIVNWHMPFLCQELQHLSTFIVNRQPKPYDEIINIPPGTTKSSICTVMWPVWLWTQDASIRIITNSHSSSLSIEHATKSRDILESEKFKRLFPEVQIRSDKGAKGFYANTQGGSRYTTSTGSSAIGEHAHVIINDDPSDPKQIFSDALKAQVVEKIKELSTRKVNKLNTITLTIMQRLHEDDATGYILATDPKINHICLPAEVSDKVKPSYLKENYVDGLLDPNRQSLQVLDDARRELGSARYSGQYDQTPTAKGGNIIKESWFQTVDYNTFKMLSVGHPIVFFGDTAYTKKDTNDPSGFIATCLIGNNLYISNAKSVRMKFPDLIRFLPGYLNDCAYSRFSTLWIEPKASGISVMDQLQESTGLNVRAIESDLLKVSKETRLITVSPKIEALRVFLVAGEWNDAFIDQVCGFPHKRHDEYVDCLSYAIDYHFQVDNSGEIKKALDKALQNLS